jgi:hypothetical protein
VSKSETAFIVVVAALVAHWLVGAPLAFAIAAFAVWIYCDFFDRKERQAAAMEFQANLIRWESDAAQQQCFADRLKWPNMSFPVWHKDYCVARWPSSLMSIVDSERQARVDGALAHALRDEAV